MGMACTMRSTCSIDDTFQDGFSGISRCGVEIVTGIALVSLGSRTSVIVTGEWMFQNGIASVAPTSIWYWAGAVPVFFRVYSRVLSDPGVRFA